ncbi:MAG TPA: ABC transporter ATP-binding protein [Gemmatimonadaceae bacterium]|nr:ABC transporter ATP-binding protein [Gemmatimonadaceae bacterium]
MTSPVSTAGGRDPLAIRMEGIDKTFGSVRANRGASLEVKTGEIHALVGENGAGKSTLMKILGGLQKPDAGKMEVNGRNVTGWSTSDAIAAGIGVVHQHFMLVPTLTVAENIVLGMEPTRGVRFDYARAVADVQKLSAETGLAVFADAKVSDLSVGEAQRVEILKTLFRGAKILVLDEPTAVLSPPEVKELWTVLRRLRDAGGTIVLITHRLDEVIEISDVITVMRAGQTVDRLKTSETTPAQIARAMVGRDVVLSSRDEASALGTHAQRAKKETETLETGFHPSDDMTSAIRVNDLVVMGSRNTRAVDGVTFSIRPGEILGIAGVEGNGQTELIEALAGLRPIVSGLMRVNGHDVTTESISARRDAGLSHIPEDRHRRGLVLDYSIADNLVLGLQTDYSKRGILSGSRISDNARKRIETFDIRPPSPDLPARALSGGNQQKVVIAREMGRPFTILLASQPTRGVDVGAIEFIHKQLREARAAGAAVLLVSAELNEILALADRVAVMYRGKLTKVIPVEQADEETLGEYMTGTRSETAA